MNIDEDCYEFSIIDTGGNGGNVISLKDHEGNVIYETNGNYRTNEITKFYSDGILGISENLLENIAIYPNPASTVLNINNAKNANIQVFDILGKTIFSQENISVNERINISNLENGTYFIKISMDNAVTTKKFLIFK